MSEYRERREAHKTALELFEAHQQHLREARLWILQLLAPPLRERVSGAGVPHMAPRAIFDYLGVNCGITAAGGLFPYQTRLYEEVYDPSIETFSTFEGRRVRDQDILAANGAALPEPYKIFSLVRAISAVPYLMAEYEAYARLHPRGQDHTYAGLATLLTNASLLHSSRPTARSLGFAGAATNQPTYGPHGWTKAEVAPAQPQLLLDTWHMRTRGCRLQDPRCWTRRRRYGCEPPRRAAGKIAGLPQRSHRADQVAPSEAVMVWQETCW